jgi:ABC-type sugar transport system substrate-binding protein
MPGRISTSIGWASAAVLAAGLVSACGSSGGGASSAKNSMAVIAGTKSDDFYVTMECGAVRKNIATR